MTDRNGRPLRLHQPVVVPCTVHGLQGGRVVLKTDAPIVPPPAPPQDAGSVHWFLPHQVEAVESAPDRGGEAEAVAVLRVLSATAGFSVAGRCSVDQALITAARRLLQRIDAGRLAYTPTRGADRG